MPKTIILFLSFLLFAFHNFEKNTKNDWVLQNLRGKVKSISENEYNAVQNAHKVKKGASTGSERYVFNEIGNMIEQSIYNPDGTLFSNFTCTYDGNGNKIEQNRYTNGILFRRSTFTLDNNGNCTEETMYKPDGKLFRKFIYKYDDKGNKIEKNAYKPDGSITEKFTYKYDNNSNEIEENRFIADGSIADKSTFKYDDNSNKTEENKHNPNGSIAYTSTFKYEYGKNINWIKRIEFDQYKKPIVVVEREIEYF
ncbi:MAG: hypothetical protein HY840_08525 [Bacteroidetes bacterium]|nr:hypothetical protein [Bacteroidota bacterium]